LADLADYTLVYCDDRWQRFDKDYKEMRIKLFQYETGKARPRITREKLRELTQFLCMPQQDVGKHSMRALGCVLSELGLKVEEEKEK
jgi:hypothetical protein